MKPIARTTILLAVVLALLIAPMACAEPSEAVKGIFDALLAEDSDYSANKALYAEYYPDMACEEALTDDGFTITVTGSEYMDGSWTFTQDGDALVTSLSREDYSGQLLVTQVVNAVGAYYGLNTDLLNGYIFGLGMLDIDNDNFVMTLDEATGSTHFRINIAGPWEMKELDQMVLDGSMLCDEPLNEEYISAGATLGRFFAIVNGNVEGVTILLSEYGALDDLAYQSIVSIVSALQPNGWEDFAANYTALENAEADGWSVELNADAEAVNQIYDDFDDNRAYAIVQFGATDDGDYDDSEAYDIPEPAEAPTAEALAEGYFGVLARLEHGTAGASLKSAIAASEVCAFAIEYDLYNPDVDALRANMLEAYEAMSEEEQAAFWEGFNSVNALLYDCLEDYEANRAMFDDAGVADAMDMVMYDPLNRLAWENLRDHTLTLGNQII